MSGVTEDKQLAGPVLAFVGGFVILVYGGYEWYVGAALQSTVSFAGLPGAGPAQAIEGGLAGVVCGVLITACAAVAVSYPRHHSSFGVLLILLAIVSLVSLGGGNGVGFLLVVLGGTCCMVYGPAPPETRRRPALPKTGSNRSVYVYACPSCSQLVPADADACEHCGALLSSRAKATDGQGTPQG